MGCQVIYWVIYWVLYCYIPEREGVIGQANPVLDLVSTALQVRYMYISVILLQYFT